MEQISIQCFSFLSNEKGKVFFFLYAQVLVVGQQMESSSGDGCRRTARSIHRSNS